MDTITVATPQVAQLLRNLDDASATVIKEGQSASRAILNLTTQVGEGQGHMVDFSEGPIRKYQEALVRRETLLSTLQMFRGDYPAEALEAAAQGRGVWFDGGR